MHRLAGIADGSEWIGVRTLRRILDELPDDAMVQASPLGNLVIYDGLSGMYSVHYDASKDMASPTPWPAAGKTL